jgi:hypothetical protein
MERQKLLSSSQKYKQALEDQVSNLRENAIKVSIQGLLLGGVAIGTWLLIKALTGKTEEEETPKGSLPASTGNSFTSGIMASIQSSIATFLLSIAREKIMEIIESYLERQNAASGKNQ